MAINRMMVVFPLLFLVNKVDFTVPEYVLAARAAFGVSFLIALAVQLYVRMKISAVNNTAEVEVPKPPVYGQEQPADAPKTEKKTIRDYDLSVSQQNLTQALLGVAITTFIHYKWNIIPPLVLQAVMNLLQLTENKLVRAYLMGEDLARPFVEPKQGLAALFEQQGAQGDDDVVEEEEPAAVAAAPSASEKKEQ